MFASAKVVFLVCFGSSGFLLCLPNLGFRCFWCDPLDTFNDTLNDPLDTLNDTLNDPLDTLNDTLNDPLDTLNDPLDTFNETNCYIM